MTISSEVLRVQYTANGSNDTFAYTFRVDNEAHILVQQTTAAGVTTTVSSSDYTVTGVGVSAGGNVVFDTAPTSGYTITLTRDVPLTQEIGRAHV
jgi:hypothetical protein